MTTFRYVAIPRNGSAGTKRRGEISGASDADVRASLRAIGLHVVSLRELAAPKSHSRSLVRSRWHQHLRRRRQLERAELCDSLATMLESGVPLLESVSTVLGDDETRSGSSRIMLVQLRDHLQSGGSLAEAIANRPDWWDAADVAMVEAGQKRGELADVLRQIAVRSARGEALSRRLMGVMTYPSIVTIVGIGVVLFLSNTTLPELTKVLTDAQIEIPLLTRVVMSVGQFIVGHWLIVLLMAGVMVCGAMLFWHQVQVRGIALPRLIRRLEPRVLRRLGIAALSTRLADLTRTGIPIAEALRITAPTLSQRSLRRAVLESSQRIERGHDLASALDDREWFDNEYVRLVEIGQASGELDTVLTRLSERYERQAERLIERLATVLEPTVIVMLAVLVGTVVMSAILPLLRMQEILR